MVLAGDQPELESLVPADVDGAEAVGEHDCSLVARAGPADGDACFPGARRRPGCGEADTLPALC